MHWYGAWVDAWNEESPCSSWVDGPTILLLGLSEDIISYKGKFLLITPTLYINLVHNKSIHLSNNNQPIDPWVLTLKSLWKHSKNSFKTSSSDANKIVTPRPHSSTTWQPPQCLDVRVARTHALRTMQGLMFPLIIEHHMLGLQNTHNWFSLIVNVD